ncbi:hypothetical protein SAMN04489751_3573 [Brevibacterium sandarakinum]|uniref:Uncharacterized protein n=1 Tax=Brevibacterium sandarakinum TaxID=629680 RepID=A0A1H1X2S5_BRESA|nr:hypothetical protein SAMN04489751_3573 [Brevibacterium sandarakinum]
MVGQCCADSNFDALERVHDQQAQGAVEDVKVQHIVERGAFAEELKGRGFDSRRRLGNAPPTRLNTG